MTPDARGRIDLAVDLVLAQVITAMGQRPFGRVEVLVARLDLFLVGMAVNTEGFLMAGCAGKSRTGIDLVLEHKIRRLVIEGTPRVAMALGTVGQPRNSFGMDPGDTGGVCAGMEEYGRKQRQDNQKISAIFHSLSLLRMNVSCQRDRSV